MDFIFFMMLLNLMLFSPNLMDYLDKIQVTVTKPEHGDNVSTGDLSAGCRQDNGIPYYCMGKFVRLMEI